MRILHLLDHSVPVHSGYSFRTRAIIEHQRARGWYTDHLTSIKHVAATALSETVDGLHFHRTPAGSSLLERLPLARQYAVVSTLKRRLKQVVPQVAPDLIHAHSPCLTGLAALDAGRRFGLPVVYEVRALWEEGAVVFGTSRAGGLRYRASRALETFVLKRADAVTTICEGLRRELVSRGLPDAKVTVVANAVDVERFRYDPPADAALKRRLGLQDKRVVSFIGSFYEYEGLALLLRALPDIAREQPGIRLLLVGGGQHEPALKEEVRRMGLAEYVRFTGRVPHDQIESYYAISEILIYPRLPYRGAELITPLKPLEAMAMGRAVVASDVGGHKELIRHGETGLLFRAGDAGALAATLLGILEDGSRRAALCAAGRRYVETERSWTQSVARYEKVYADALASRARDDRLGQPAQPR